MKCFTLHSLGMTVHSVSLQEYMRLVSNRPPQWCTKVHMLHKLCYQGLDALGTSKIFITTNNTEETSWCEF